MEKNSSFDCEKQLEILRKEVEILKDRLSKATAADVCDLKMANIGQLLNHIDEKVTSLERLFLDLFQMFHQNSHKFVSKEDLYKIVMTIASVFTVLNVLISLVVRIKG